MGTCWAAVHLQMIVEEKCGKWGLCSLYKFNALGLIAPLGGSSPLYGIDILINIIV